MGLFSQATLYFTILGPVVRRPISAIPELNSNPGCLSLLFKRIFSNNFLQFFVRHPMNKLRIKISKLKSFYI